MTTWCLIAAVESLEGAEALLGRADELLERAGAAARSAGDVDLARSCRTRRHRLREEQAALAGLITRRLERGP
jgi:hypothetical protein